jgi:hypothetical protein
MRTVRMLAAGAGLPLALTLSSCSGAADWGTADAFYAAVDGDSVTLVGIDLDAPKPAPMHVADIGPASEVTAATVAYGPGGPRLLISQADGSRQIRAINAAAQHVTEGLPVPDYGTVVRIDGGFALTTPEVAGPVRVQMRTDDGKQLWDAGPLTIHPTTMAGTRDDVVVAGPTSQAGTVMQRTRGNRVLPPVVVAADALPGQVAADAGTVVVTLNRAIPKGASPNAKATLPPDKRLAIVADGQPVRFVEVGEAPNHIISAGDGRLVLDSIVDGRRVIQLVSNLRTVSTLAILPSTDPVLGLAKVGNHILALQSSSVHIIEAGPSPSEGGGHKTVELTSDAYSEWAAAPMTDGSGVL